MGEHGSRRLRRSPEAVASIRKSSDRLATLAMLDAEASEESRSSSYPVHRLRSAAAREEDDPATSSLADRALRQMRLGHSLSYREIFRSEGVSFTSFF